jgi:lipoate-protein ligase A
MAQVVRLLDLRGASGAANMAADEVLLEAAARGIASLRFYTWAEPTLSLGYFQAAAERLPHLPLVRRASGGAALVHDCELTYCLALPAGAPWQRRGESWICRFHAIITSALEHLGIKADKLCGTEQKLGPVLCFLHHTPGDLILDGRKIGGSAQRKQRGALMQHGGILLAQSPHTPQLPGMRELAGVEIAAEVLAERIARDFARDTGWELVRGDWSADERRRIQELTDTKYKSDDWNLKR